MLLGVLRQRGADAMSITRESVRSVKLEHPVLQRVALGRSLERLQSLQVRLFGALREKEARREASSVAWRNTTFPLWI